MVFVAFAGLSAVALTIGSFFGAYWWPLDLVANFRPQLGGLALLTGGWLLAARWPRTGRTVLLAALANLALVGWLWMPVAGDPPSDAEQLRVVTFNVLAANENYDLVLAYLREVDADVVFLHESSRPWEDAIIRSDLGYRIEKTRDDDHIFGTLVLVRGAAEIQGFGFTEREPRSVEVQLTTYGGRHVSLLAVHPLAPVTERTAALRDAQLSFAGEWAAKQTGPTIVTGDFNAGPWSHAFRRLLDQGSLRDSQRGFGFQPTFPASSNLVFRIAIDHLLVSDGVWVVDRRLGPALGSDHFPLIVDLAVR